MTVHIYAVVDKAGTVINRILVDQDTAATYWPGYGHGMIDCGPAPVENQPVAALPPAKDPEWGIVGIVPDKVLAIGDTIDFKTGAVTEKVVAVDEGAVEVLLDGEPVKL